MTEVRIVLFRFVKSCFGALFLFFLFLAGYHFFLELLGFRLFIFKLIGSLLSGGAVIALSEKIGDYGLDKSDVYAIAVEDCEMRDAMHRGLVSYSTQKLVKKVLSGQVSQKTDAMKDFDASLQEVQEQQPQEQQPQEPQAEQQSQESQSEQQSQESQEHQSDPQSDPNIDLSAWGSEEPDTPLTESSIAAKIDNATIPYVEDCMWSYAFANESKGVGRALSEAFVIYQTDYEQSAEKVKTIRELNKFCDLLFWVIFVLWCISSVQLSLLNIITMVVSGKLIKMVIASTVIRPLLLHLVVKEFSKISWNDSLEGALQSSIAGNSTLAKLSKDVKKEE